MFRWSSQKISLRNRIFVSMIFLTIISTVLIAGVSILQYQNEAKQYHNEKFLNHENEILQHINYALATTSFPINTQNVPYIFREKIHEISSIHKIEVNFYDLNGKLIKSSASNFAVDSVNTQLSEDILKLVNKSVDKRYVERFVKDNQKYLASYTEIRDEKFKPIAILNLPYIEDDKLYNEELEKFLINTIQVYLFILTVSIFLAYYLSNYITNSLKIISEKINEIQLTKKNEKIHLDSKSKEIGLLVHAYNDLVDQLEESAKKLAQSEREGAWREMAKQIAHEVKNPLTPMKLTIQNFERKFDVNDPKIAEKLNQYTQTLLEQIDTMSAVANTFSNFASLPVQNNEWLHVNEVIGNALQVFESASLHWKPDPNPPKLFFDRSQLVRLVTNLVKNALQATESVENPDVQIKLSSTKTDLYLSVSDNGIGIPESIQDKIFEPKFTTKTRGMGLGLAIIKNIIESYQGSIQFTSVAFQKTEFIVHLPLHSSEIS